MTSYWGGQPQKSLPVYHDSTTTDARLWCVWCRKMVDVVVRTSAVTQEIGTIRVEYSCPECKHLFHVVYEGEKND